MVKPRGRMIGRTAAVFTLGAAAGSLIGLLLAPASGRVTRKRLITQLRNARRIASRQLEERMTEARRWFVGHVVNGHNGHTRRLTHRRRVAAQHA